MLENVTLVLGLDKKHLEQLALVWPTWMKHKPELRECKLCCFYDWEQISPQDIQQVIDMPGIAVPWPEEGVHYPEGDGSKWFEPQRVKMLSGFVHIPAKYVKTSWWLKIDTDTIATGSQPWIPKKEEFRDSSIIAQKWGFTKPADQMQKLDEWVERFQIPHLQEKQPVCERWPQLKPREPGQGRVGHSRIISWIGFFATYMTRMASDAAQWSMGPGQLPCGSQDGYLWYYASRMDHQEVKRKNFKSCGWLHRSTMKNVREAAEKAMQ